MRLWGWRREDWLSLAFSLTVVLVMVGLAAANAGEVRSPLEAWGLSDTAYPEMSVTIALGVVNALRPVSPPPWTWAPVNGTATCRVSVDPGGLEPLAMDCPGTVTLRPGENLECTVACRPTATGVYTAGLEARCSYLAWKRYTTTYCGEYCTRTITTTTTITNTTTTVIGNTTTTTTTTLVTNTTTTSVYCCITVTETRTATATRTVVLRDSAAVTVIPRSLNRTYMPVSVDCSWPAPGEPGTCTLRLWNLAAGMLLSNTTLAPMNPHMLLLYRPKAAILWNGSTLAYTSWEGYAWPAGGLEDAKPVAVAFNLTPMPPYRTYTLTVVVGAVVDEGSPAVTYTYNVVYPYGWAVVVDDECRVITWTPVEEPRVVTEVVDARPPRLELHNGRAVVVDPGPCGGLREVRLLRDGGVYRAYSVGGRVFTLPPLPPGNYMVVAVDRAGNRATGVVEVRETSYKPETMWPAIMVLLAVLAAVSVAVRGR